MKIAILTFDFHPDPGGVQAYLYEIAVRVAATASVTVLIPSGRARPGANPLDVRPLPRGTVREYRRALRCAQPDRVLVGHAHPRLLLAALCHGRYAAVAHGNDFLAAQDRWHRPLFNALLRRARPLLTNSRANAARLSALRMRPAAIIPPGADPHRFAPAVTPPGQPTLLTVGRLVPRKGIDTVLRALPGIRARFPDTRYVIAGDGPDRARLAALARDLGVETRVQWLGRVPDEALPRLYRAASVFVMPVREDTRPADVEGFGIVFLEASACGLPVVAARSGGVADAVRDGETGILVSPGRPWEVEAAVLRLLEDPSLRERMGRAGRRQVETEMNWDRAARQLLEALA